MSTSQDITSVGRVASSLGVLRPVVDEAATALGLKPEIVIDRVPFYNREQVEQVTNHLKSQGGQR